jgi:hypothetical protein
MALVSVRLDYPLQPWEQNPRQLVTWWEVFNFSAWNFFWCGHALERIEHDCFLGSMTVPGDARVFALPKPLDDKAKTKAIESLKRVAEEFNSIGLRITSQITIDIVNQLENPSYKLNFQWLIDRVRDIGSLSKKEFEGKPSCIFLKKDQGSGRAVLIRTFSGRRSRKPSRAQFRTSLNRESVWR